MLMERHVELGSISNNKWYQHEGYKWIQIWHAFAEVKHDIIERAIVIVVSPKVQFQQCNLACTMTIKRIHINSKINFYITDIINGYNI